MLVLLRGSDKKYSGFVALGGGLICDLTPRAQAHRPFFFLFKSRLLLFCYSREEEKDDVQFPNGHTIGRVFHQGGGDKYRIEFDAH